MNAFEIAGAILMIITSVLTVIVISIQKSKGDAMSSLAGGGGMDSFFGQNNNRTFEAMLVRLTKVLAVVFFVVTIAVYAINVYMA